MMAALVRIVELLAHGVVVGAGTTTSTPRQTNSVKAFGRSDLIVATHSWLVLGQRHGLATDITALVLSRRPTSRILADLIVEELVLE